MSAFFEMTVDDARVVLAAVGWQPKRVVEIPGGWASWTFEVDDRWIVQFPRNAEVAAGQARARQILPELREHASFAVPVPRVLTDSRGLWGQYYEKLPGGPCSAEVFDARAVGATS